MKLEWQFTNFPLGDISAAISNTVSEIAQQHMPDIADMFPLQSAFETLGHFDEDWFVVRITHKHGFGIPSTGNLEGSELEEIRQKVLPFVPRTHTELFTLLGSSWFSSERFTYIGPYKPTAACWPDVQQHLVDWLNHLVVPEIMLRNQARVLRAIPPPPQFNLSEIRRSVWVLECEEVCNQGTAFTLLGIGLVTCHYVLGKNTQAFKPEKPSEKFQVRILSTNEAVNLAVLAIDAPSNDALVKGTEVTVTFRRVCAKLEILNFRFHDLRHTAASRLRMQGADIHTVAQLLGHKDLRMAARYQHLSPAFLAEAVNRLDAVFGDLSHHSVTTPKALPAAMAVSV